MMKRMLIIVAALALLFCACGEEKTETVTQPANTSEATTHPIHMPTETTEVIAQPGKPPNTAEETTYPIHMPMGTTKVIAQPGKWTVTIERLDLNKPESKKYIDWADKEYANRTPYSKTFNVPEYFDVKAYRKRSDNEADTWIDVREDEEAVKLREKHRPWNATKELIIRNTRR